MVGGIKASRPRLSTSAEDLFLDLPTMSAPSGEDHASDAAAQVERAARTVGRRAGPGDAPRPPRREPRRAEAPRLRGPQHRAGAHAQLPVARVDDRIMHRYGYATVYAII